MADEGGEGAPLPEAGRETVGWILRIFSGGLYFVAFAVIGTFLSALALYVYGALVVVKTIWDAFAERDFSLDGAKRLQVAFVQLTDVFLLGTVLVIVAFGLYQLFIRPGLPVPDWLRIRNLDQLTDKLLEVVGVLLSVTFLAFVVEMRADAGVLELGGAVALVIAALALLLVVSHHLQREDRPPRRD